MAAQGIVGFHENAAPHIGPESEIPLIRQAADGGRACAPPIYWGELMAVDTARRLGAAGLAGDLVADGALGSRTASLAGAVRRRPGHLRPRVRHRRAGPRPRRRLHRGRAPGRLPRHRRRRAGGGRHRVRAGRGGARRTGSVPGTGSSTSRCRRRTPSRSSSGSASSAACSRCSTRCGVARTACTPPGWATGGATPTRSRRSDAEPRVRLRLAGHPARSVGRGPGCACTTTTRLPDVSEADAFRAHTAGGWAACGDRESRRTSRVGARADLARLATHLLPDLAMPDCRSLVRAAVVRADRPRGGARMTRADQGKLDLDPAVVRRARTLARKAGRPIVKLAQQHTTVAVERATLRLGGLGGRRRGRHPVGEPAARRRPRRPGRGRRAAGARRRPARCGTRWCAARPRTWPPWPRRPVPARCGSGSPRAATRRGPVRPPAARSAPGSSGSTHGAGSASGWSSGTATRRGRRGST